MPIAVLFPGQGALTADSGAHARDVVPHLVDQACELVGSDPFERANESTRYSQPATLLASLAGWEQHAAETYDVIAMAGHSLGELSALVAARALDSREAVRLVVIRGRLMAEAAALGPEGGMVAVLGCGTDGAASLAERYGLTVANDNAPGQVVLSGPLAGVETVTAAARRDGLKTMRLAVAGAFHSPAMAAAEGPFRRALEVVQWRDARLPVISGCTAAAFQDIPLELSLALVRPVRWREVMTALIGLGCSDFVDVGPGNVLDRLVKRNLPRLEERAAAR